MSDKRDVILPWGELQDLLMYFHTMGDEKAVAMLRNLAPIDAKASLRKSTKDPDWKPRIGEMVVVRGEQVNIGFYIGDKMARKLSYAGDDNEAVQVASDSWLIDLGSRIEPFDEERIKKEWGIAEDKEG